MSLSLQQFAAVLWRALALLRRNGAPAAALFGQASVGTEGGAPGAQAQGGRARGAEQLELGL